VSAPPQLVAVRTPMPAAVVPAASLEPVRARAPSDPRDMPVAKLPTPVPSSARAVPESLHRTARSAPHAWLWPGVVLVVGLAVALTLQFQPNARRAVRALFEQDEAKAQSGAPPLAKPPAPVSTARTPAVSSPAPLAAPDAKSSERVLRLDELPLQRASAPSEPEAKAHPRKPVKKLRRRPVAAAPAPPATQAEPAPAPAVEPPITLDE
jgi:hypothetical protein